MYPLRLTLRTPAFAAAQQRHIGGSSFAGSRGAGASQRRTFERCLAPSPPTTALFRATPPTHFAIALRSFHRSPQLLRVKKSVPIFEKVFSWKSFGVLVIFGGAYIWFIESVKKQKAEEKAKQQNKTIGQAALGGDWALTRLDGTKGGSEDLRGDFALIYFGFTHCPDICPEEIEKAVKVVDAIDAIDRLTKKLIPVFITIDPERDTATVLKDYIAEFTPKMIGYVGTPEEVKAASRKFRIYYSKGPEDEDGDYIVDHSIIMYLVNPDGTFNDYYGQDKKAQEMIDSITLKMMKWDAAERREGKKNAGGILGMLS